jgi:uncharacterized protein YhbP (UPF0306 family)
MTREELEKTVVEFMDSNTTITLSCSLDDRPWAAAVYYARRGFDLVFFSSPQSRHSQVFARNPRAAGTIHGEYGRWEDIRGLQIEGTVEPISSALGIARATAIYLKRYPFVSQFFSDPGAISAALASKVARVALYVLRCQSIRYVNNAEGFGRRWKLEIRDGRPVGDPVKD